LGKSLAEYPAVPRNETLRNTPEGEVLQ
jgi:hypothetical protein